MGGGMNGGTTDLCSLAVTEALMLGRVQQLAVGVLFVDVVSAFPTVARRLSMPCMPDSELQWRRHLSSSGFSLDEADEIVSTAPAIVKWQDAGASHHSIALLSAVHRVSWFTIDGINGVNQF